MNWVRHIVLPLIATVFWGFAFVPQKIAAASLDAISLNMVVNWLAFFLLLFCTLLFDLFSDKAKKRNGEPLPKREERAAEWKTAFKGGFVCGTPMAIAVILQQQGIALSGAGKSGFLTALYVVFVPVFSAFLGRKAPKRVWIAVLLAIIGLYFLCLIPGTDLRIQTGDWFLLACAVAFSVQILAIHHFGQGGNSLRLSCTQVFFAALICTVGTLLFSDFSFAQIWETKATLLSVLYVAFFSRGLAYTLQFIAQKGANPTLISLIMSLESVFAVLSAALILHEFLTGREALGCAFVFAAIILSQIPIRSLWENRKSGKKKDPQQENESHIQMSGDRTETMESE